ncbi:hypothetical protein JCM10213v2_007409 [Rhodosporidiobolus nylandii]
MLGGGDSLTHERVPPFIDSLTEGHPPSANSPSTACAGHATIRNFLCAHLHDRLGHWIYDCPKKDFPLLLYEPISSLANFAFYFSFRSAHPLRTSDDKASFPADEDWYIKLLHHLLIFLALRYRDHQHLLKTGSHARALEDHMLSSTSAVTEVWGQVLQRDRALGLALEESLEGATRGTRVRFERRMQFFGLPL